MKSWICKKKPQNKQKKNAHLINSKHSATASFGLVWPVAFKEFQGGVKPKTQEKV